MRFIFSFNLFKECFMIGIIGAMKVEVDAIKKTCKKFGNKIYI